ncbi:MAG TPA: hypothetical protein VLJ17_21280 [Xanthobacteraceae bacterium]|nr:hypothetical protein [Xanthobacteraceae bacterium]
MTAIHASLNLPINEAPKDFRLRVPDRAHSQGHSLVSNPAPARITIVIDAPRATAKVLNPPTIDVTPEPARKLIDDAV